MNPRLVSRYLSLLPKRSLALACMGAFVMPAIIFSAYHHSRISQADTLASTAAAQPVEAAPAQAIVAASTTPSTSQPAAAHATPQSVATSGTKACTQAQLAAPAALDMYDRAPGVTHVDQGTATYRVYGHNADEIRRQIVSCSPVGADSNAAAAVSQISYAYTLVRAGNTCSITNARVGLVSLHMLPAWAPDAAAPADLIAKWNNFVAATATHENGHTAIDIQYAHLIMDRLNQITDVDCIQIDRIALQDSNALRAQLNTAQANYDAATRHGATQGAAF